MGQVEQAHVLSSTITQDIWHVASGESLGLADLPLKIDLIRF